MLRSLATGSVGLGVTAASTFAPALGLSLTQQRIGFAFGVALIIFGVILFYLDRSRAELGDQIDSMIQEGIRLVAELSIPVEPERIEGDVKIEFGDAPQERWDKADEFFKASDQVLKEHHPALLKNFEEGFNGHLRKEREAKSQPDPAQDERSNFQKTLAFANDTQRGPAMVVEATLDGLAAARRQWGMEAR
jgi:hypothetical protein